MEGGTGDGPGRERRKLGLGAQHGQADLLQALQRDVPGGNVEVAWLGPEAARLFFGVAALGFAPVEGDLPLEEPDGYPGGGGAPRPGLGKGNRQRAQPLFIQQDGVTAVGAGYDQVVIPGRERVITDRTLQGYKFHRLASIISRTICHTCCPESGSSFAPVPAALRASLGRSSTSSP